MPTVRVLLRAALISVAGAVSAAAQTAQVRVMLGNGDTAPMDGRLLLIVSTDSAAEPRLQGDGPGVGLAQFGSDVTRWTRGTTRTLDAKANATPLASLQALPRGRYWMQAVFNVYQTFHRADGVVAIRRRA